MSNVKWNQLECICRFLVTFESTTNLKLIIQQPILHYAF